MTDFEFDNPELISNGRSIHFDDDFAIQLSVSDSRHPSLTVQFIDIEEEITHDFLEINLQGRQRLQFAEYLHGIASMLERGG
jgi:hypothetical protein